MKIYTIDDKREELKKAETAIHKNGHKKEDVGMLSTEAINDFSNAISQKKRDDYHHGEYAQEELFKAVEKIKKVGGGIITDMMFHLTPPLSENDPIPPSGLLVVMHCLAEGVPVVVCTDAAEVGGHHAQALHWIFDGYVRPARDRESLPFGWIENKDWDAAVKLLEEIHAKQKGGDK